MNSLKDINFTNIKVLSGKRYNFSWENKQKLGLPSDYSKEHEIIVKETVQCIDTKHRTYYGFLDTKQSPVFGKLVTITNLWGTKITINTDDIRSITDIQAVLVKWDIFGYDSIVKEIKDASWAYNYVWYRFDVNDKVYVSNENDSLETNIGYEEERDREITHMYDYEGK